MIMYLPLSLSLYTLYIYIYIHMYTHIYIYSSAQAERCRKGQRGEAPASRGGLRQEVIIIISQLTCNNSYCYYTYE